MKRFLTAFAFACALSGTVLAGNIPTGGIAPPPPENPVATVILTIISIVI